jgi:hypothetical protein
VFGQPSPYVASCPIVDTATGRVRYDWLPSEAAAAVPGQYNITVRFVKISDPDQMFEVPSRRTANFIIRPRVTGHEYMVDGDGELVLTAYNQPIEIT